MKTVRDYMSAAQQFHYCFDEDKFRALVKAHGVELAMLKFILVRYLEKRITNNDCSCCAFSRQAKVWFMCDKYHKHATHLCESFQLNDAAQEFDSQMREYIAAVRNIHDYDEFFKWLDDNRHNHKFYEDACSCNDFYDCLVDESAAQKALCILAKNDLKETEDSMQRNSNYLAKLQQSIVDVQNALTEQQNHVQHLNDFLNNLIQG